VFLKKTGVDVFENLLDHLFDCTFGTFLVCKGDYFKVLDSPEEAFKF